MAKRALKKILIVDDDPDILTIAKYCLEKQNGIDAVGVASGEEALLKAPAIYPDLILLDILMPKMDGIALFKLIRQMTGFARIPIIFFSASPVQDSEIQKYLELGAAGVITKPFDPLMLMSQIRAIWERTQESL